MTSQIGQQIITKHLLPNISGSKGYQAIEFVQLMKYSVRNILFKNQLENEVERLVPDSLFVFEKSFI